MLRTQWEKNLGREPKSQDKKRKTWQADFTFKCPEAGGKVEVGPGSAGFTQIVDVSPA